MGRATARTGTRTISAATSSRSSISTGIASPLKYVKNVKTPTLVLHSDNDFRVPIEQGEQWFRALQHFGVPSEIVFFPRENHNLTRTGEPKHLVESINWQVYWFDRYLNGNANAVPPDAPPRKGTHEPALAKCGICACLNPLIGGRVMRSIAPAVLLAALVHAT